MEAPLCSLAEAVARVQALDGPVGETSATEPVPLSAIDGRLIADRLVAEDDRPPVDRATMDGFALDASADYPFTVHEDRIGPEDEPSPAPAGVAVPIATGGPLPPGTNAVLKREEAAVTDGRLRGPPLDPGTFVQERGSDVAAGEVLFSAGERLAPKDAILFADLGIETVTVRERPTAAVLATGTEIHEGRQPDRDSAMLAGLLAAWGAFPAEEDSVPDDSATVRSRIASLAAEADLVVTSGGTSVGGSDYVVDALRDLGEVVLHGVAVRPGKPVAVARLPAQDALAVAVPGKPLAAHTAATLVLRPALLGDATLPTIDAALPVPLDVPGDGFVYAVPVTVDADDGHRTAMPVGHGAGPKPLYDTVFAPSIVSSSPRASRADGFVLTTAGREADTTVDVVPSAALS